MESSTIVVVLIGVIAMVQILLICMVLQRLEAICMRNSILGWMTIVMKGTIRNGQTRVFRHLQSMQNLLNRMKIMNSLI